MRKRSRMMERFVAGLTFDSTVFKEWYGLVDPALGNAIDFVTKLRSLTD